METQDFRSDDRLLISLLMNYDEAAWNYVITDVVKPVSLSERLPIRRIFQRYGIPIDSVGGEVFDILQKNEFAVLRSFRYDCKFTSFLFWYIRDAANKIIRKYCKKNEDMLSDTLLENTLKMSKDSSSDLTLQDDVAMRNQMLAKLWQKNPAQAFVLLLRQDLELSSKTVGVLLDKTPGNIDKMNQRAKEQMYEYLKENEE